ncbi:BTB/POZ domain-containing adapter for CUL3-mediated RhoA degradation protein 2, partial [Ophiophagus hannah]
SLGSGTCNFQGVLESSWRPPRFSPPTTAESVKPTHCRVVIYLQKEMSGDTCLTSLCPASGAKPKRCSAKIGTLGNKYVRLNVGGSLYYTTVQVLTRHDTMLKAMLDPDRPLWEAFWNHLKLPSGQHSHSTQEPAGDQGADGRSQILPHSGLGGPLSSCLAVVKLLYNRSNNKYSYTSNSDDNLLKNIELFDKLSLRFNKRVLFIKDVIGDEICCWSFFGQGRKLAEVCCTSIVYATEKKQTKTLPEDLRAFENKNPDAETKESYRNTTLRLHYS